MSATAVDLHQSGEHAHPGAATYIKVAIILVIVTITEVAIWYIDAIRSILVPALIILSVFKFCAVVGYFMHLKFDDRRLLTIFAAAMAITLSVVGALDVLHRLHYIDYASNFLTASSTEGTP
jgi:cytochrome c oxidase subunit 4